MSQSQVKRIAHRYRIYPTRSQVSCLKNHFSMCRHLYNWALKERIDAWEAEKRTVNYREQQNALPSLKDKRPWFKGVYSICLQDVLRRLDKAYKNFFRGTKSSERVGFPRYKKRGQWDSISYSNFWLCKR